jgi:hypothetical protein
MAMVSISWRGTTRKPVVVIGPWTLKIAHGLVGRRCNQREAELFRTSAPHRQQLLCPVLWVSRKGLLLIMATAQPLKHLDPLTYYELCCRWDHQPGEDGHPFEFKASSWGLYDERPVANDYSTSEI